MSLAGLILAAGESRRMGTPKALLELDGTAFLDRLVLALSPCCAPVIVVLGCDARHIQDNLRHGASALFVVNQDYRRGQLSSLQCGLESVPADAEGVMFTPVDYPAVLSSTVARIAARFEERGPGELLVVPRSGGRRGHPVCAARELIPEFLALPADAQARDVIHRHREHTAYVDVEDEGVVADVDDPEAYERLRRTGKGPGY